MKPTMNRIGRNLSLAAAGLGLIAAAGCSSSNTIPMKIQSDPLGAYVLYQKRNPSSDSSGDWIYLGKTPINVQHSIGGNGLSSNEVLRLRVMKDGYSDQIRDWSDKEVDDDIDRMGHLFWNPRLVPGNQ